MRGDLYTRVVVTIIALTLGVIGYRRIHANSVAVQTRPHVLSGFGANIYSNQTVTPGTYAFQSAVPFDGSIGMCWHLRSQDVGNDYVRIQQNGCDGTQNQHFIVGNLDANGFYEVTTQLSGYKYVDNSGAVGYGMSANNGALLPATFWHWRFVDVPNGSGRRYIVSEYDGSCVDRPTEAMNPGDRVQTMTCNGNVNQQWIPIGGSSLDQKNAGTGNNK